MTVNWGDAPAWVAAIVAVLALFISIWSAAQSRKSLQYQMLSAQAAMRSAEAAEAANLRAERAEGAVAQHVQLPGIPSEEAFGDVTVDTERAPNVSWRIERPEKNRYILRNTGTDIAEHVEVDPTQAGPVVRNLPEDAVIRPGEGVDMLIMGVWGHPVPNQLYVRWAGQPDWVAVPIS